MLDWPLIDGWPQALLTAIGLISLGFLLYGRTRRWWTVQVPIAVGVGVLGGVVVKVVVDDIWQPFPEDPLPTVALVAVGLVCAAIALAAMKDVRWRGGYSRCRLSSASRSPAPPRSISTTASSRRSARCSVRPRTTSPICSATSSQPINSWWPRQEPR